MIDRLLTAPVAAHEHFGDIDDARLFPAEQALVETSSEGRRREFGTVRHLARAAMRDLGCPEAAVLPGPRREPLWPAGLVGTMTHCAGYRAAALARRTEVAALGLDAEPNEPLAPGVLDVISLPGEREQLPGLRAAHPAVHWDRLLFCVKEAVYKTWYPLAGTWLGFQDALVTFAPGAPTFTALLQLPGPVLGPDRLQTLHGRWRLERAVLSAAITVPAPD
ncbi:4'-phosphopantetheinyl transferase superfamily protein [Streptomyces sp. NPDC013455]|uniref:4'-phosphopantetheinyl transferase family protein n=1 Tax=Streptomyces sp. NPDC013455 TaxID=3155605 RepID=UPI0033C0BC13